jgi:hypothetical protein
MRKILGFLAVLVFLISCNSYGDKLKINDKSEVYYKDGATKEDAKKLGDYLLQNGYFDTKSQKSIQLSKNKDTFNVKFVVDKKRAESEMKDTEGTFTALGMLLSYQVFNGKPTRIMLADQYMKTFRELPAQTLGGSSSDSTANHTAPDSSHEVK